MGKNQDDVLENMTESAKKRNAKLLAQYEAASPHKGAEAASGGIRHKFGAVPTTRDGFRFDSKGEARHYDDLMVLKELGEIAFVLRQVPMHFPDGTKLVVDFQVFWTDGTVTFEDYKGMETESFRIKLRMLKHYYPMINLKLVKG